MALDYKLQHVEGPAFVLVVVDLGHKVRQKISKENQPHAGNQFRKARGAQPIEIAIQMEERERESAERESADFRERNCCRILERESADF